MNKVVEIRFIILTLALFIFSPVYGSRDIVFTLESKNVIFNIKTSSKNYFEFEKAKLYSEALNFLLDKYDWRNKIRVDFIHGYTGNDSVDYFMSIDRPKIIERNNRENLFSEKINSDSVLYLRVVSEFIDVVDILKLTEFGIQNFSEIVECQNQYLYHNKHLNWVIYSLNPNRFMKIISDKTSRILNSVIANPYYERLNAGQKGFSYYLRDGNFHIYKVRNDGCDSSMLILNNLRQFESVNSGLLLAFEDYESFYALSGRGLHKIRVTNHDIYKGDVNFLPYEIIDLGGDKILIRYHIYGDRGEDFYPGREILYLVSEDRCIDDFDLVIKSL